MKNIAKIYETGLLYHHYANNAYPLTPGSFMEYKVKKESDINSLLIRDWKKITDFCLYLHIPFCHSRCKFCEYTVIENPGEETENEYVELLIREMQMYAPLTAGKEIIGFDIGGGTPLKLSVVNIAKLTAEAEKLFQFRDGIIRSIETTPVIAANEPEKLLEIRKLGCQRISMGIQTVSPHLLNELGREGEPHIYEKAVHNIRKAGFDKFNIDLMYGFLNQSDKDLETTILYAIALKPTQITLYRNRYKGTKLEDESGGVSLYKAMRQYQLAYDLLSACGYKAEIGKNTFSSEENDWGTSDYLTHRVIEGIPYLGLGLGAQSMGMNYLSYNEGAASKKLETYRSKILAGKFPLQDIYDLPQEESIAKMIAVAFYFGFINLKCFEKRFGIPLTELFREEIAFLIKRKFMEMKEEKLMLTKRGAGYINGVIPLFYSNRSKKELVDLYERKKLPKNEGEAKFLATYSIEKYNRPSVSADIVAMTIRSVDAGNYRSPEKMHLSMLLIRRGEHPYMNCWGLPGGFLRNGEAVEHCAQRELFEETGLNTNALYPLGCFSQPGRDPRGWIISNAFLSIVGKDDLSLMSGDDAMDARWFDLSFSEEGNILFLHFRNEGTELNAELKISKNAFGQFSFEILYSDLAFDHAKIIASALKGLQTHYSLHSLAFAFLPAEFTFNELQKVHELLTGKEILAANFRRKMMPYLSVTDRMTQGEGHRPAQIYTKK